MPTLLDWSWVAFPLFSSIGIGPWGIDEAAFKWLVVLGDQETI